MCVIERKTYIQPDGDRRTIETIRHCVTAPATGICSRIEHRTVESTRYAGPTAAQSPSREDIFVTRDNDGHQKVYRDLSRRNSNRKPAKTTRPGTGQGRRQSSSGTSSPTPGASRPSAPTPPLSSALPMRPSYPPTLPPSSDTFRPDGTAVYHHLPSMGMKRAIGNERRPGTPFTSRSPVSSRGAEVDDPEPKLNRRPSISIRTSFRRSMNDTAMGSPVTSSPGLSNLPKLHDIRHDSANVNDLPQRDTPRSTQRSKPDDNEFLTRVLAREEARKCRSDQEARQRHDEAEAEDRRQADLELDRYLARDRARENAAAAREASRRREEASRERHRRATASALEASTIPSAHAARIEAENLQLDMEAARAAARRTQSEEQPTRGLVADEDPRARSYGPRESPIRSRLPRPVRQSPSPLSPRAAITRRSYGQPIVHQQPQPSGSSSRRPSDNFRDKGRDVIAREQACAAATELQNVLGDDYYQQEYESPADELEYRTFRVEERRPEGAGGSPGSEAMMEQHHYVSEGLARRESRRRRREDVKERRKAEFWR